jgi:hypothetical protein
MPAEHRVLPDRPVQLDRLVRRVHKDLPVLRVLKGRPVQPVLPVLPVPKVQLDKLLPQPPSHA